MSTATGNLAAWQHEKLGSLTVSAADMWEPGESEVRIKIMAAAIQPAEAKQAKVAIMPRFKYPGILGSTCAGIVDKLGPGVTKIAVGDRVSAGLGNYSSGGDPARASLQRYAIAEEFEVIPIGDTLSFVDAVPRNSQSPAAALFKGCGLDYPLDKSGKIPERTKKGKILIWGGSSAMGSLSIGYAKRAGYEVLTVCSKQNFKLVEDLGADHVFDRNTEDLTEQVKKHLPIDHWFDTISLPDSISKIIDIATVQHEREGQDIKLVTLLPTSKQASPDMPDIPGWLKTQMTLFRSKAPENADHIKWLLEKDGYLESGMKGGWIKGVPAYRIGGLGKVQEGIDMVWDGVSARKVIVEPWAEE